MRYIWKKDKGFYRNKENDDNHPLEAEMFIEDKCRLPGWKETENLACAVVEVRLHLPGKKPKFQFRPIGMVQITHDCHSLHYRHLFTPLNSQSTTSSPWPSQSNPLPEMFSPNNGSFPQT